MRVCISMILCAVLLGVSQSAMANPFPEDLISQTRPQNSSQHKAETANPTTMPWCQGKLTVEQWPLEKFPGAIHSYHDFAAWADAAERLCEHKEDPTWVRQATSLVQAWMNANENSQPEAEKEIRDKIASLKQERSPAGQASAEEQKFAFSEGELDVIKPRDGVDEAKITGRPSWCDVAGRFEGNDNWNAGRIHRTVDQQYGIQGTIEGALHICQRPTDTTWKTEATSIVQKWMNWTRLSQADAEKAIRARIQSAKFAAQRDELCKALQVSPEISGGEKTYADARIQFFGCAKDGQTIWQDPSQINAYGLGFYLDGETQPDEIMRAYWLFAYVREPFSLSLPANEARENLPLQYYAVAQTDFARLDVAAINKTLSAAPYNEYARIVAMETLGVLKGKQKVYEKAVEKMTKGDEDYMAILRTAPKKAYAQWDKLLDQWKPEIERSGAFEKLLSQPSRKALRGCSVELFKDGQKVVRSLKTNVYKDLVDKISGDPIANLVLGRLAVCYAADKVWGASGALRDIVTKGRNLRGPRSLAYYAVVDAIAEAKKDRPRMLLDLSNFFEGGSVLTGGFEAPGKDLDFSGRAPQEWEKTDNKGFVASTTKVADGVQIVFKKATLKYPDYECHDDTRHPLRIASDGRIEYYRNCKALGTFSTQDMTPNSIVIAPLLDGGIKPGVFLQFVETQTRAKNGNPLAVVVCTKKTATDTKINSFFGFGL
jgi:hypothetical protein